MILCWKVLRSGKCLMPRHHKGRCSTVTYRCRCGGVFRGRPMPGDVCFLCWMAGKKVAELRKRSW